MYSFKIDSKIPVPKVKQIVLSIKLAIENAELKKNDRLLSINEFKEQFKISRDTVEKAYNILKEEGYISSVFGRGYYVAGLPDMRIKVLLVFNKLSSYKKNVYDAFVKALGSRAKVDLHIHHYNPALLKESLDIALGNYNYYVIMPHFFTDLKEQDYIPILKSIPANQLILLDKNLVGYNGLQMAVYQDFQNDIYQALCSAEELIKKYKNLTIVFPQQRNHPTEIKEGVKLFCKERGKQFTVIPNSEKNELKVGNLYIVLTESDLAQVIMKARKTNLIIGADIGIISFNETVFKELLDITVITTDFKAMGETAARLILKKEFSIIKNPFKLIIRNSL